MQDLIDSIRDRRAILFVGAGASASLGLPTWSQLIDHVAKDLDYDPSLLRAFGDQYSLAEFYAIEKKGLGNLRSWMDRSWHAPHINIGKSRIHHLIVALRCPIIYTTNYDRWLELAHDAHGVSYSKIVNVSDIPSAKSDKVQIVKFHGDFENDDSLVLTESSYFERLSFDAPLDVRLRSDLLGRNVLFIGYSLTDVNMRLLLYRVGKLWEDSRYKAARPKAYLFMTRPNAVQEAIFGARGIQPIVGSKDDHTQALDEFLTALVRDAHSTAI